MLTIRIEQWAVVLAIDFLWSLSYTLWPRGGAENAEVQPARAR